MKMSLRGLEGAFVKRVSDSTSAAAYTIPQLKRRIQVIRVRKRLYIVASFFSKKIISQKER